HRRGLRSVAATPKVAELLAVVLAVVAAIDHGRLRPAARSGDAGPVVARESVGSVTRRHRRGGGRGASEKPRAAAHIRSSRCVRSLRIALYFSSLTRSG